MKGRAIRDERPSVLFYGLTARDVVTAEYLASRMDGFVGFTAGPAFGYGYFGWSGKPKPATARRRLRRLAVKVIWLSMFVVYLAIPWSTYRDLTPLKYRAQLSRAKYYVLSFLYFLLQPSRLVGYLRRKLSAVVRRIETQYRKHPSWWLNFLLGVIQSVRSLMSFMEYLRWKRAAAKLMHRLRS